MNWKKRRRLRKITRRYNSKYGYYYKNRKLITPEYYNRFVKIKAIGVCWDFKCSRTEHGLCTYFQGECPKFTGKEQKFLKYTTNNARFALDWYESELQKGRRPL